MIPKIPNSYLGTSIGVLQIESVRKEFGGLLAVSDLDFTIPVGSIVSLIGPNGAGKTTFFNMLTGVYKPTSGQVVFDGTDVTGKPPHAITKLGIGRTFQNIRLFPQMTALENVLVGMHSRLKGGILGSIFGTPRVRREEREAHEKGRALLRYAGLGRVGALAGRLRRREQDAVFLVGGHLPQIDRMRLLDVHDEEGGPIAVLRVKTIELGNSRAKRRSRVAAEDEDHRLLTVLVRQRHRAIAA